jgi:alcohol dehydrogenase YqhD (iron-dependent ADH family)
VPIPRAFDVVRMSEAYLWLLLDHGITLAVIIPAWIISGQRTPRPRRLAEEFVGERKAEDMDCGMI